MKRAFTLILFTVFVQNISSELSCFVASHRTELGQTLKLMCQVRNTSQCISSRSRLWKGGRTYGPILLNGKPKHSTARYNEVIDSCTQFSLVISNVKELDFHQSYGCALDFEECKQYISFSNLNFKYIPSRNMIETEANISLKQVSIRAVIPKIFPAPNCSFIIGRHQRSLRQTLNQNGYYYSVDLVVDYNITDVECPFNVSIRCLVRHEHFIVFSSEVNCPETMDAVLNTESKSFLLIIIPLIGISLPICIVTIYFIVRKTTFQRVNRCTDGDNENYALTNKDEPVTTSIPSLKNADNSI